MPSPTAIWKIFSRETAEDLLRVFLLNEIFKWSCGRIHRERIRIADGVWREGTNSLEVRQLLKSNLGSFSTTRTLWWTLTSPVSRSFPFEWRRLKKHLPYSWVRTHKNLRICTHITVQSMYNHITSHLVTVFHQQYTLVAYMCVRDVFSLASISKKVTVLVITPVFHFSFCNFC